MALITHHSSHIRLFFTHSPAISNKRHLGGFDNFSNTYNKYVIMPSGLKLDTSQPPLTAWILFEFIPTMPFLAMFDFIKKNSRGLWLLLMNC